MMDLMAAADSTAFLDSDRAPMLRRCCCAWINIAMVMMMMEMTIETKMKTKMKTIKKRKFVASQSCTRDLDLLS